MEFLYDIWGRNHEIENGENNGKEDDRGKKERDQQKYGFSIILLFTEHLLPRKCIVIMEKFNAKIVLQNSHFR